MIFIGGFLVVALFLSVLWLIVLLVNVCADWLQRRAGELQDESARVDRKLKQLSASAESTSEPAGADAPANQPKEK